jgi:hypothetical protein
MSANYWESTQRQHWLFTKDQLASMRQKLDDDNAEWVKSYPLPEQRHLAIFFNQRASSSILSIFMDLAAFDQPRQTSKN